MLPKRSLILTLILSVFLLTFTGHEFSSATEPEPIWSIQGTPIAICACSDAKVVVVSKNLIRVYYQLFGSDQQIVSKSSTDNGATWTADPGVRISNAAFPEVIKLKDGSYRMYVQTTVNNVKGIGYSTSTDGLAWSAVTKIVLGTNGEPFTSINVGNASVLQLSDGSYLMAYISSAANGSGGSLMYATSSDGDTWTRKGFIVDDRSNQQMSGQGLDGPELVQWDSDHVKLYFTGHQGIQELDFVAGQFVGLNNVVFANVKDSKSPSGMLGVGDVSLAYFGDRWHMFFGIGPVQNSFSLSQGIYDAGYQAGTAPTPVVSQSPSPAATAINSNSAPQPKKGMKTITCTKAKTIKKITGFNVKCPPGYQQKK
jgi:BNR repeat-like domain